MTYYSEALYRDEQSRMLPGLPDEHEEDEQSMSTQQIDNTSETPDINPAGEQQRAEQQRAEQQPPDPVPTSLKPEDITVSEALVLYAEQHIGQEGIGDPLPSIVDFFFREETGEPLSPVKWRDVFKSGSEYRVDMPRRGDIVRFQYMGLYDRSWFGIVKHVRDSSATVIMAQSLRQDAETELREVEIRFRLMFGWSLNRVWPVTAFVRFD